VLPKGTKSKNCLFDSELKAYFVDVNECENNNGGCDDTCENTLGSFMCSCGENKQLIPGTNMCEDVPDVTKPPPAPVRDDFH